MLPFAPGARAVIRDEEWLIRRVDPATDGGHLLTCDGISDLVRDQTALSSTRPRPSWCLGTLSVGINQGTTTVVEACQAYGLTSPGGRSLGRGGQARHGKCAMDQAAGGQGAIRVHRYIACQKF